MNAKPVIPTEILNILASIVASQLDETGYVAEPSGASATLGNLALTSRNLRDIAQPYLFSCLEIRVNSNGQDSWVVLHADEGMAIFRNNSRLFDYIQHLKLKFAMNTQHDLGGEIEDNLATCQDLLLFFLPNLRRLRHFTTESHDGFNGRPSWSIWNEATRAAVSSCVARNPFETLDIRCWKGPFCFLKDVPPSLVTLRVSETDIDFDSTTTSKRRAELQDDQAPSLRATVRPNTLQLDNIVQLPRFITKDAPSQLRALELKNQGPRNLNALLVLAPQSLQCLRLRYSQINGFLGGSRIRNLYKEFLDASAGKEFVSIPGLQELGISLTANAMFVNAGQVDLLAEFATVHLEMVAFAPVRKLALRFSWEGECGCMEDTEEEEDKGPNIFLDLAEKFKELDQTLSGDGCALTNLRDVDCEVKLQVMQDPHDNPEGCVEHWFLKYAEEDILEILEGTRAKFNCNVIVSQETLE
ncbi:hypothetical protein BKA70DRAFT_1565632 [Coprinopsis sp. MPI-PUGE-AT-0042]|nr:hypothetical protein BKA70DRAFT_1565632 [Coprinopsis sp. MPI-PUGE-AT-0042]